MPEGIGAKRNYLPVVVLSTTPPPGDPVARSRALPSKGNALRCVEGDLDAAAFEPALAAQLVGRENKPSTHRYFIDDDELIHANGKTYAVAKMWGSSTVPSMEALIKQFPGHGISYAESL